jgi:hypothetical protein
MGWTTGRILSSFRGGHDRRMTAAAELARPDATRAAPAGEIEVRRTVSLPVSTRDRDYREREPDT